VREKDKMKNDSDIEDIYINIYELRSVDFDFLQEKVVCSEFPKHFLTFYIAQTTITVS